MGKVESLAHMAGECYLRLGAPLGWLILLMDFYNMQRLCRILSSRVFMISHGLKPYCGLRILSRNSNLLYVLLSYAQVLPQAARHA